MNWKEVYKLPIEYDGITYCWSENNNMVLMFEDSLSDKDRNIIVSVINGESDEKIENITFNGPDFFINGNYAFCVRGWGNLIGVGGLNLPEEKAEKIQDDFILYVYNRLKLVQ